MAQLLMVGAEAGRPVSPPTDGLTEARTYLIDQSRLAAGYGSPFVAAVLAVGAQMLPRAPLTARLLATWPGDRGAAALAMRFNAALHAIARRGTYPRLSALFRQEHDDFVGAIGDAMAAADDVIAAWMQTPTQTNEVGRAAAFAAALLTLSRRFAMPFELVEIGSSAGLNLNLAHYRYDLGGVAVGAVDSPLLLSPAWKGPVPPVAPIAVADARGVDLNPLDVDDPAARERLLSHIFVDQRQRADRLLRALEIAQRHPPRIDRAAAGQWLPDQLARPQAADNCRVVFHSMVLQYIAPDERDALIAAIHEAGARATPQRPFAWISLEWTRARDRVQLWLTSWPDGEAAHLADCDPYGAWIEWRVP